MTAMTMAVLMAVSLSGCGGAAAEPTTAQDTTAASASKAEDTTAADAGTEDKGDSGKVYKIATDTTFAPFEFEDDNGEMVGIDLDLLKAIAEDQGFEYELVVAGFSAATTGLEAGEDAGFLNCMEYFSAGSRDTAVEEIVLKLYDFAMSTPFPEKWLEERKRDYRVDADFGELPWVADMLRQTRLLLQGCIDKLSEAVRLCGEPDGPYMYGELLEREQEMAEEILRRCEDYDSLYIAFGTVRFDRLPSKKDETVSPVKRELAKSLRTQVKEQLGELQKKYFFRSKEQILQQMEVCGAAVDALVDLTLAFKRTFDTKKRDKNLLDFDDIEHFALSILVKDDGEGGCMPTETALEYRSYFHEILIDEYQDSNLVQEYILSCISGEAEGRYNRFMVGDVKQSIYKFRLARPELFLEKYKAYAENGRNVLENEKLSRCAGQDGAPVLAEKIDLHQNFRSRKEVLNSTNKVFAQIMGKDVGGIVYDDLAALHAGAIYPVQIMRSADGETYGQALDVTGMPAEAEYEEQTVNPNDTELLLYRTGEKPEEISTKEQEAYGVAQKIKELMRTFQVTSRESGAFRKLCYKDIVILLRTVSGWDEVFKRILEEEGIPVHMTSRTGYFAASEVQELLHFLRIMDNPLQDIPLYGVMHSYLGGFSEEELAQIRAFAPKKKYLYDAVVMYASFESGIESCLADKIRDFLARLDRYRELSAYLSVQELLQVILRETGYLDYVAVKPEGNKRRANVEMLLVKAVDYEKTSYFGLNHFLRYMEQLEKYEVDYGEAGLQDENADVVRIMSIHKSKGLEFPVCFVSGLAKGFQNRDLNGALVIDIDAGIGVDYVNPTMRVKGRDLRRNVIAEKMRADNLAEEMRILYVAMTRAKEKLILTGTVKDINKTMSSLLPLRQKKGTLLSYDVLLGSGSFLDLLLYALARNHCMDELYVACGLEPVHCREVDRQSESVQADSEGIYLCDMSIRVSLSGWEDTVEDKLQESVRMEEAKRNLLLSDAVKDVDGKLMGYMEDRFAYRYPHENLSNLYTKTTVSELKMAGMQEETDFSFKLFEEETVVPYLPGFLEKDERVSGSMRGSAFHKVMELFDFTKLTKEVNSDKKAVEALFREQFAAMQEEGRLSDEYAAAVSGAKITAFLMTDMARRMGEAARAGKLHKEQPFVMGLPANRLNNAFPEKETVLIQGIIDVFFEENGRYVLLDYKTDAVETAEELVKRYHVQLDYYAEALEQASGCRDTERILYSFKLGKEIPL